MLREHLTRFLLLAVSLVLVGCFGKGLSSVDHYSADGTITDGELEHAWRLAEECMIERGNDAFLRKDPWGYWGLSLGEPFSDADYEECTSVSSEVARLYWVERIPEGAERLELAESLAECFRSVEIELVYNPDAPDEAAVFRSVWKQLGYALDDRRIFDDPRFLVANECVAKHELLFPAGFHTDLASPENGVVSRHEIQVALGHWQVDTPRNRGRFE